MTTLSSSLAVGPNSTSFAAESQSPVLPPTYLLQPISGQKTCLLREISPYSPPKKKEEEKTQEEKKEEKAGFANELSNATKALVLGAFSFIAAQAFNAFFQNLISILFPPSDGPDWKAVIARFTYLVVVVVLLVLVAFLIALTSKKFQKQALFLCPNLKSLLSQKSKQKEKEEIEKRKKNGTREPVNAIVSKENKLSLRDLENYDASQAFELI